MLFKLLLILISFFIGLSAFGEKYKATTDLNIRNGEGTNFDIIGKIPKGSVVEIFNVNDTWAKVNYQGIYGYASVKYLDVYVGSEYETKKDFGFPFFGKLLVLVVLMGYIFFKIILSALGKGHRTEFLREKQTSKKSTALHRYKRPSHYRCARCGKELFYTGDGFPPKYTGTTCINGDTVDHAWNKQTF